MISLKLAVCVCVIFTLGIEADQIPPWWTPPTQRAVVTQHPLWWIPTRYEYNRAPQYGDWYMSPYNRGCDCKSITSRPKCEEADRCAWDIYGYGSGGCYATGGPCQCFTSPTTCNEAEVCEWNTKYSGCYDKLTPGGGSVAACIGKKEGAVCETHCWKAFGCPLGICIMGKCVH